LHGNQGFNGEESRSTIRLLRVKGREGESDLQRSMTFMHAN